MQSVAFTVALRPGRTEAMRVTLASCRDGPRTEAYEDARRRAGIVRESVWVQLATTGHVAVVYLAADDLAVALTLLASSTEPFDRWFRDQVPEVLDIASEDGVHAPELLHDFDLYRP